MNTEYASSVKVDEGVEIYAPSITYNVAIFPLRFANNMRTMGTEIWIIIGL